MSVLVVCCLLFLLQIGHARCDSNKQAFCDAVRSDEGLYGMVNCTHTAFPVALKPYMNFCKGNISGNVTYETHFRNLCEVEGYDNQVQRCMARRMEERGTVIRIHEREVSAYTGCINAVERRVHEMRNENIELSDRNSTDDQNEDHQAINQPEQDQQEQQIGGEDSQRRSRRHLPQPFLLEIAL